MDERYAGIACAVRPSNFTTRLDCNRRTGQPKTHTYYFILHRTGVRNSESTQADVKSCGPAIQYVTKAEINGSSNRIAAAATLVRAQNLGNLPQLKAHLIGKKRLVSHEICSQVSCISRVRSSVRNCQQD